MSWVVGLPNNSYKPITNTAWVRGRLCKLQKGCTRLAATSDKVYQLLAYGRWFSPGTPLLPPLKLVAMIQLKVALSTTTKIVLYCMSNYNVHVHLNFTWNCYIVFGTLDMNIRKGKKIMLNRLTWNSLLTNGNGCLRKIR